MSIPRAYHDLEADQPDSAVTLDEGSPRTSRIAFHDSRSEDRELPAPETSTAGVVIEGVVHANDLTNASDPYHRGRCSPVSLHLLPSEENAGDMGEEGGGPAVALRGTRRYHCVVRSLLTSTSSGDRLRGAGVWGSSRSH